jgi:subtilisin family serine protease
MKKILFCLLGICAMVFMNNQTKAQTIVGNGLNCYLNSVSKKDNPLKNSFMDRFCTYNIDGKEYISLILRVKENSKLCFLKNYDCKIGSREGRIVTLRLNTSQINKLIKEKDILEIETARRIGTPMLNNALYDLKVYDVQNGVGLNSPYTGKDVIVGIADWGFDYTHPNLYDTLMNEYRVLAAWDQYRSGGNPPDSFSYGSLIEGKDALLNARCDTSNIYDSGYHATHVAGITGGGGAGTDFRGIAIDCKWLCCSWLVDEASVMDGYTWMKDYAKRLGKRLVINNSWGVYLFGRMDGKSMMDEFINTMSDNDSVVFVVSAGNNGDVNFHIDANFNNSSSFAQDTIRSEASFDFPPRSNHYWGETLTLEGDSTNTFSSKIEVYDYAWQKIYESPLFESSSSVVPETTYLLGSDDSLIYRASSRNTNDGVPIVDWEVRMSKYTNNNHHVVLAVTSPSGHVHAWNVACLTTGVGNWGLDFEAHDSTYIAGDNQYSVSEPALAEKVITVAAYRYKKNGAWTPTIAYFSSRGKNLCSYLKPEISAPGYSIVSSVSSFASEPQTSSNMVSFNGRDYYFSPLSGTSMSGPMVSGTVALMLQANKNLTPIQIKEIIEQTARTDAYTEACPNYIWGYGKMDSYNATKKAEERVGIDEVNNNEKISVFPIPTKDILHIGNSKSIKEVKIFDVLGREVMNEEIVGNTIDISHLDNGVYILNFKTDSREEIVKIIKK